MASPEAWLTLLATIKAAYSAAREGADFTSKLRHYLDDEATNRESRRVSSAYSTYNEEEIRSIARRLRECAERFAREGDGEQRVRCICSALNDARLGNGGELPAADDWENYYRQLRCWRLART